MTIRTVKLYFVFFMIAVLLVFSGMHYYVYIRIARGLMVSPSAALYLKLFFGLAGASFFLGEILRRSLHVNALASFGSIWLGILAIAVTIFLFRDIVSLVLPLARTKPAAIAALILSLLLAGYSLYNAARVPHIKEIKITIAKLPPNLAGFTIVQLSDLHLVSVKSARWLENIVSGVNSCRPDLIVITGDLLDEDINRLPGFPEILRNLSSKNGIIAVTGNHEFYSGIGNFMNAAGQTGIVVLRNQNITVSGGAIQIAGLDDRQGKAFGYSGARLDEALNGINPAKPLILLSHRPEFFDSAALLGIDLMLSGHTHAGQIPPMDLIVWLYYKYSWGLYQKGSARLYVTSGAGTWGPPMRLFSGSEIVKITLVKE